MSVSESGVVVVTITGYDYWQKLKAPRAYWLKKNWFRLAVLFVTAVPVSTTLIVTFL